MARQHRNPTSYSSIELKKLSTSALMDIYAEIYGAFPNTFDRETIRLEVAHAQDFMANVRNMSIGELLSKQYEVEKTSMRRWANDQAENRRVEVARQAKARGEQVVNTATMTDHEIRTIRQMHAAGMGVRAIASEFGKKPAWVKRVVRGELYKNVQ